MLGVQGMTLRKYVIYAIRELERVGANDIISPNDAGPLFLMWIVTQHVRMERQLLDFQRDHVKSAQFRLETLAGRDNYL